MKKIIVTLVTTFLVAAVNAQEVKMGSITLTNGTVLTGQITNNIDKKSSVKLYQETNKKTANYDGLAIDKLTVENINYLCIKGDFFKKIVSGKTSFLQKVSKTSNKVIQAGNEIIGAAGTIGKKGDYFLWSNGELTLLTNKTSNQQLQLATADCGFITKESIPNNIDIPAITLLINTYNTCK